MQAEALDAAQQASGVSRIMLPAGGTGQAREAMTPFEDPIAVYVQDLYGEPVENAVVTLAAPAQGASAYLDDGGTATTDGTGLAQLPVAAGAIAGVYTIEAWTDGAPAVPFVLRNLPTEPRVLVPVAGMAQASLIAKPFAPLAVLAEDRYGNPTPGVDVHFSAPTTGATAMLGATSATTGADGRASITAVAGTTPGTYVVEAEMAGETVEFVLSNVARMDAAWAGLDDTATAAP